MARKILTATLLVLSCTFIPAISSAEETKTPAVAASNDMPKDDWLNSMAPMLPDLICKGFIQDPELKKRFDEIKMTYDQCVTLIPKSNTKCQNQLYASIPDTINSDNAAVWGKSLGECIGRDFAENYLIPKK